MKTLTASSSSQRGVVLVLVTIAMLVLIGMVGLALDMGHAYLGKTRLQNVLDAAALSGAKTLDLNPGNLILAEQDAKNTFALTAAEAGNQELDASVSINDVIVEFYATLIPLQPPVQPGNVDARYVRVSVNNFDWPTWLIQVLPGVGNIMQISGSAMAGPSPKLLSNCDLFPILLCVADPDDTPEEGASTIYGYNIGDEYRLDSPPGDHADVGPGNYKLLAIAGSGANILRQNFAGMQDNCSADITEDCGGTPCMETQPGQDEGAIAKGVNTRFGEYLGAGMNPDDFPPDKNTCHTEGLNPGGHTFAEYQASHPDGCIEDSAGTTVDREWQRRVVQVPVTSCDGDESGRAYLDVLDTICMYLTKPVQATGPAEQRGIYAEFMPACEQNGVPGPDPGVGPGPYTIQLYQDPLSNDS